jgi:hypothetical protein
VALEYLVAVPGGAGRQHRYMLADPPDASDHDLARGTPRPARDCRPRSENGPHAGGTEGPALDADASGAGRQMVVAVGAGRGTNGGHDGTFGGAR